MGTEAKGMLTVGGQKVPVRADFGSDRVLFSGGRRGTVPYKEIEVIGTSKGKLRLRVDGAVMEFDLGGSVDRIANKIRKPPSRLDKMGIERGATVAIVGLDDPAIPRELAEVGAAVVQGRPAEPVDIVLYGVRTSDALEGIVPLIRSFAPDGELWVVYPKARKEVTEMQVIDAGRAAGLKDVKAMRFSDTLTALKFVVPLDAR